MPWYLKKPQAAKGAAPRMHIHAHFFAADQRAQAEVQPNRRAYGQQGADKLPGGESEKDGLLIIPDFFWYFYFYIASLLLGLQPQ